MATAASSQRKSSEIESRADGLAPSPAALLQVYVAEAIDVVLIWADSRMKECNGKIFRTNKSIKNEESLRLGLLGLL